MAVTKPLQDVIVFLDRDGTLNEDSGYLASPDQLVVFPGAAEAVARLNHAGALVILITNQSGLARKYFSLTDLKNIHRKLEDILQSVGGRLDGIFYCPHHPDESCHCRKPRDGMIQQAQQAMGLDISKSYMVGDKQADLELAVNVGAIGVLVMTSPFAIEASERIENNELSVGHVAQNFSDAVDWIIQDAPARNWEIRE